MADFPDHSANFAPKGATFLFQVVCFCAKLWPMNVVSIEQSTDIMRAFGMWCEVMGVDGKVAIDHAATLLATCKDVQGSTKPSHVTLDIYVMWEDRGKYNQRTVSIIHNGTVVSVVSANSREPDDMAVVRVTIGGMRRTVGRRSHDGETSLVGFRSLR